MDGFSLIILPKCHKKVFQKLSCHLLTNIEKTEVPKDWLKCDSLKGNTMTLYHVHLFQTVTISGKFNIFNYFAYYLFCDIKANNVSLPFEASHEDTQDVQLKIMNKNLEFPTAQYGSSGQYILLIISLSKVGLSKYLLSSLLEKIPQALRAICSLLDDSTLPL